MRPLNWIQWLTLAMVMSLAVVVPLNIIEINQSRNQSSQAIRTVLCYFEARALSSPILTAKQKRQAIVVYRNALAQIGEPECGGKA